MRHVVVDVETAQSFDHVIEIAAVEIVGDAVTARRFIRRVRPRAPMNSYCFAVHGIRLEDLRDEPFFEEILPDFAAFVGEDPIVAHNYSCEYHTLRREFERARAVPYPRERYRCTMALARGRGLPGKLRSACAAAGIGTGHLLRIHDALTDALLAADLFLKLRD